MKKLLTLCFLLALFSCDETGDPVPVDAPDSILRQFVDGRAIHLPEENRDNGVVYAEGENTIIRFDALHEGLPNTHDTGYTETVLVEVPKGIEEFSFTSVEEMQQLDIELFYMHHCECSAAPFELTKMDVYARKLSADAWYMTLDLGATALGLTYALKDQGTYHK